MGRYLQTSVRVFPTSVSRDSLFDLLLMQRSHTSTLENFRRTGTNPGGASNFFFTPPVPQSHGITSSSTSSASLRREVPRVQETAATLSPLKKPKSKSNEDTELPRPQMVDTLPASHPGPSVLSPLAKPPHSNKENIAASQNNVSFTQEPCGKCPAATEQRDRALEEVQQMKQAMERMALQLKEKESQCAQYQSVIAQHKAQESQWQSTLSQTQQSAQQREEDLTRTHQEQLTYKDRHIQSLNKQIEELSTQLHRSQVRLPSHIRPSPPALLTLLLLP